MSILGNIVTLRAIEPDDLRLIHKWSNDSEVEQLLGGWHFPSSYTIMEDWFQRIKSNELNQRYAIITNECGLIGTANLVEINWKDRNAFHGMMIGEKNIRGKGFGTDTVMTIMRYAFEELGLERLDGSMIEYNEPSIKLYCNKCGWKVDGRKKNAYWRKNRFWDKILVGINREDYIALIKKTNYWNIT